MRTLAVAAITSLIALAVASVASAAPTVSLVWVGTTGAGTTGGSSIAAAVGDTLTVHIQVLTGASGVTGAGLSLDPTVGGVLSIDNTGGGVNDLVGGVSTNFQVAGSASYGGPALAYVPGSGVKCPAVVGQNLALGICGLNPFLLANATPAIGDVGGGVIGPFNTTSGGPVTTLFTLGEAQFVVVPEPATGGLLALGLGALAFIGRRRA